MGAIQDAVGDATTAVDRTRIRAQGVRDAVLALPRTGGKIKVARGRLALTVDDLPEVTHNRRGDPVGVGVMLRAFRDGSELHVDPHRIVVNPPAALAHDADEEPAEAWLRTIEDSLRVAPNPAGWRTRGTVTTFYGDTADQDVYGSDATWLTARAGTGAGGLFTNFMGSSNIQAVVAELWFAGMYRVCESFEAWDTSSIPDSDTVSAAVLSLYGFSDGSTQDFTVRARLRAWRAAVTTGDFVAGADLTANTLLAGFTLGSWSTSGYNDFTSEAAFAANVSKTGYTEVLLHSSLQESTSAPTANSQVTYNSADDSGTTKDPKLVVTHAAAASGAKTLAALGVG